MSERGQSDADGQNYQPPSPYDEPTGSFRKPPARPQISEADRDAFYERHHRRPGPVSRVESLDDIAPDEVETTPLQVPRPQTAPRRNPVPMPPVTAVDQPTTRIGDPAAADTAPTTAIDAPKAHDAPASSAGKPGARASDAGSSDDTTTLQADSTGRADSTVPDAPTPIPSVEETFPELAKTRREATATPTRALSDSDLATPDDDSGHGTDRPSTDRHDTAAMVVPEADSGRNEHPDTDDDDESSSAAVHEPRGTLDLGLLILRLGIGVAALAHGLAHLFGWWGGPGISGFQDYLTNAADPALGFQPDATHIMAIAGGVTEVVGGALIVLGLFTPIGASAFLSVMLLATTFRITLAGGFSYFASAGGVEYEVLLAVAAAALILTGPGLYSLDRSRRWARRPFVGSVLWLAVAIAAAAVVWVFLNGANPLDSPGNPG